MTTSRLLAGFCLSIAFLASASSATAEPTSNDRAEAKKLLNHGLYLVENGAYAAALADFEKAHELVPSRLVLFHAAMAYVAMDKPVDALETLDDVLSAEGPLGPELVERAKATREEQQQRIGEIEVNVNVPATIQIDGEEAGKAPLKEPLKLAQGEHVVCVFAPGYVPERRSIAVPGQGRVGIDVALEATQAKLAHVTVYSPVPGFEVRIDHVAIGKTPFAEPVVVLPGRRTFEMRRPGYKNTERTLEIPDGVYTSLKWDPTEERSPGAPRGHLRLQAGAAGTSAAGVSVTIDGHEHGGYHEPIELPAGPHFLKLEHAGDEPIERMIEIPNEQDAVVKLAFHATAEARGQVVAQARTQQHWAIAALVTGAVIAGGSTGLAVWSNGKLPAAESKLALVKQDAAPGGNGLCDPNHNLNDLQAQLCGQRLSDAQGPVDRYHSLRTWGFVGIGVGAALVVTGGVLLLTAPNPDKGESDKTLLGTLQPAFSTGPQGTSLWLSGRF